MPSSSNEMNSCECSGSIFSAHKPSGLACEQQRSRKLGPPVANRFELSGSGQRSDSRGYLFAKENLTVLTPAAKVTDPEQLKIPQLTSSIDLVFRCNRIQLLSTNIFQAIGIKRNFTNASASFRLPRRSTTLSTWVTGCSLSTLGLNNFQHLGGSAWAEYDLRRRSEQVIRKRNPTMRSTINKLLTVWKYLICLRLQGPALLHGQPLSRPSDRRAWKYR